MTGRRLPAAVSLVSMLLVSCLELSGPAAQLSAISSIRAPWPAVVAGDALRDTVGDTAALRVEAFDADGNPVDDVEIRFVALDTGLTIREDGVVIGRNVRETAARIVAVVSRGGDVLQTPELSLFVVPQPDSVAPARDTTLAPKSIPVTSADPVQSDDLRVTVLSRRTGLSPVPVQGWLVRYAIRRWPAGIGGQRTAAFTGTGTTSDTVQYDTTNTAGVTSASVRFSHALVAAPAAREMIEVEATIRRVGNNVAGTTITFILPFDRQ